MSEPIAEGWVTIEEAARETGYAQAYVMRLARQGRVQTYKVQHVWLVYLEDLREHKRQMEALGSQKHNPYRDDLLAQGRGRKG
jgi:hypothetical protein